jgi:hypothetical protein
MYYHRKVKVTLPRRSLGFPHRAVGQRRMGKPVLPRFLKIIKYYRFRDVYLF